MSFWHTESWGDAIEAASANSALRALLERWRRLCGADGSLPPLAAFRPEQLPLHADLLILLEVLPDGDLLYHAYGEQIARHMGRSMLGTRLNSVQSPIAQYVRGLYAEVLRTGQPLYSVHVSQDARSVLTWERLTLPLVDEDGGHWLLIHARPQELREHLLDAVLLATADGMVALRQVKSARGDGDWLVALCNPAGRRLLAVDSIEGELLSDVLHPAWGEAVRDAIRRAEAAPAQCAETEFDHGAADALRSFALRTSAIPGGWLLRISDQTALKRHAEGMRRRALEDGLTGLANRRALDEVLLRECRRATRSAEGLAVAMIDVDHFKRYNDRHGHLAGDEALKLLAALMTSSCQRPDDLAARLGGEEFCLVLPGTHCGGALQVVERLRRRLAGIDPAAHGLPQGFSFSAGIAHVAPGVLATPQMLLQEADRALYRSKAGGRDRAAWGVVTGGSAGPALRFSLALAGLRGDAAAEAAPLNPARTAARAAAAR
jgi:diguanylate cyclase (GGDEF)-like protein